LGELSHEVATFHYPIGQVSKQLGVTTKSLYAWIKQYSDEPSQHSQITEKQKDNAILLHFY